jgi:hypothetical protein
MRYIYINDKELTYSNWKLFYGSIGKPMDPDDEFELCKQHRWPLPKELAEKRRAHIQKLHSEGAPKSWIAKLYGMSRTQVGRIIEQPVDKTEKPLM